jgi:hypothetical protein
MIICSIIILDAFSYRCDPAERLFGLACQETSSRMQRDRRQAGQGPAESAGPTTTGTSWAEDQYGMLVLDQKIKWPAR